MTAGISRPSSVENVSTTLSAGITDIATTASVADASSLVFPTYLVIDRVDASGTLKNTSLWEYVKVTNISGNDLTLTRGVNGSTNQAHSSGAVVEAVVTSAWGEEIYDALNPEHSSAGGHVITGTMTIAGMHLASVATIAVGSFGHLNAGASITGIGVTPVWYLGALPSLPTTSLGRPVAMPRDGTWKYANVILNANISQPTTFFDINKNYASIFDTIGRPLVAGGTFVSTASIKTPVFKRGDIFNVDYEVIDLGGKQVDATVMLVAN